MKHDCIKMRRRDLFSGADSAPDQAVPIKPGCPASDQDNYGRPYPADKSKTEIQPPGEHLGCSCAAMCALVFSNFFGCEMTDSASFPTLEISAHLKSRVFLGCAALGRRDVTK